MSTTHRHRRTAATILVGVACLMPAQITIAGISPSILDGMMTATNPGAYQSQTRMGAVGGSLTVRAPTRNVNLVTVDPPRLSMGCGSIDMYGGSFSFINADQMVAILRQIGQVAAVTLFKLAISSISEQLSVNMDNVSEIMQKLNNMTMQTCRIGQELAKTVWDTTKSTMAEQARSEEEKQDAATSKSSSGWDSFWNSLWNPFSKAPKRKPSESGPSSGNRTWRAIYRSQAINKMDVGTDAEAAQRLYATLIINLVGTSIVRSDQVGEGASCSGTVVTGSDKAASFCEVTSHMVNPNTFTIEQLLDDPSKNDLVGFSDDSVDSEDGWLTPVYYKSVEDIMGVGNNLRTVAYKTLIGDAAASAIGPDPGTALPEPTGGVVYYIIHGTDGDYPAWRNNIAIMSSPVLRHLAVVQRGGQYAITEVAAKYAPLLAEEMAVAFASRIADMANSIYNSNISEQVIKPKDFEQSIQNFRTGIAKYRRSKKDVLDQQRSLSAYVAEVAKSLGSGSLKPKARVR